MTHPVRDGIWLLAVAVVVGGIATGCATSRPLRAAPGISGSRVAAEVRASNDPRRALDSQRVHADLEPPQELAVAAGDIGIGAVGTNHDVFSAQAALPKLGPLKEELRGMVITVPERILFAPNQTELSAEGRMRLDDVVAVLLATREHNITIEGHADLRNMDAHYVSLSQRQTDAVREYIIQRSYQPNLVQAHGVTDGGAVADRINDSCIEIIISHDARSFSPM